MDETNQIKAVLKQLRCSRNLTVKALTVGLGVNATKSNIAMEKHVKKDIKKQLGGVIDPNDTAAERMDYGLQTMQSIDSLVRAVHVLTNRGLPEDVMLIQAINANYNQFYKSLQRNLTQTKTNSYDSLVKNLLILKINTIPNSTQFSDWLHIVYSTLDEATSLDDFTFLSYVVIETEGHKAHAALSSVIIFSDQCKAILRLDGNHFDEYNPRFYTSLRVEIASFGLVY